MGVVDEFQDTNEAQGVLVALLVGAGRKRLRGGGRRPAHLLLAGRGAAQRARVRRALPGPRSGRARPQLPLPVRDSQRRGRVRVTERTADAKGANRGAGRRRGRAGPCVSSEYHEAHWIARTIGHALAAGISPGGILVLARASYATAAVQTALAQAGIPHRVLGSLGLYERSEIRDALAYLTLLVNPADAQAFRRAVQAPRRGVGSATVTGLVALARERHHGDLIAVSAQGAGQLEARSPAVSSRPARDVRRSNRAGARRAPRRTVRSGISCSAR